MHVTLLFMCTSLTNFILLLGEHVFALFTALGVCLCIRSNSRRGTNRKTVNDYIYLKVIML